MRKVLWRKHWMWFSKSFLNMRPNLVRWGCVKVVVIITWYYVLNIFLEIFAFNWSSLFLLLVFPLPLSLLVFHTLHARVYPCFRELSRTWYMVLQKRLLTMFLITCRELPPICASWLLAAYLLSDLVSEQFLGLATHILGSIHILTLPGSLEGFRSYCSIF